MKRGTLIAFEGLDGSGKSTQVERLESALRTDGHDVLGTREPTPGPIGQRIRSMARSNQRLDPEEELHWFVEDRREHVEALIRPALAAGRVVLCDRYFLSSVAYQGARGLDPEEILRDSEASCPVPDLALLFALEPALGLERVRARGREREPAFEEIEFLSRVAEIFRSLNRPYIERIPGEGDANFVHALITDALGRRGLP